MSDRQLASSSLSQEYMYKENGYKIHLNDSFKVCLDRAFYSVSVTTTVKV